MIRQTRLDPKFVLHLPGCLEPGVLYVSVEYATVAHRCCCGCGEEVVTPLAPDAWAMTFDGETVSLWPSIGNWRLPCRSHYIVERGRVYEPLEHDGDGRRNKRQRVAALEVPPEKEQQACSKGPPSQWRWAWNKILKTGKAILTKKRF